MSNVLYTDGDDHLFWQEVAYTLSPKVGPAGLMAITGKACGIRNDDTGFFAVYDLPWIYPEGFDWTVAAKERLDTFLNPVCSCSVVGGTCFYHQERMKAWHDEDAMRNLIRVEDIPSALRGHLGPPEQDPNATRIIRPQ
jgi:hypothetical protein